MQIADSEPLPLDGIVSLQVCDGRLVAMARGEKASIFSAVAALLVAERGADWDTVEHFASLVGLERQMGEAERNLSAEMPDRSRAHAATACALIRLAYPVWTQLYPTDYTSDGFYGGPTFTAAAASAMQAHTLRELVEGLFGQYRRDLARVCASAPSQGSLLWASLAAEVLPLDHVAEDLAQNLYDDRFFLLHRVNGAELHRFKNLLQQFTPHQRRRVMTASCDDDEALWESVRLYGGLVEIGDGSLPRHYRGMIPLHNWLVARGWNMDAVGFAEREVPEALLRVGELHTPEYAFERLKTLEDYDAAAEEFENCVASPAYILDALNGSSGVYRVESEGESPMLMELRMDDFGSWKVAQLEHSSNKAADALIQGRVSAILQRFFATAAFTPQLRVGTP